MDYRVYYFTRWLKEMRFCGGFKSLSSAYAHVDYLQKNFPNGKKNSFKIEGSPFLLGVSH